VVTAPDGKRAIEVKIKRVSGEEMMCLISAGAWGVSTADLAQYGKEKLNGAKLGTHSDVQIMVDGLFKVIKGLIVEDRELQTSDETLKLAFRVVQNGVRTVGESFSSAEFRLARMKDAKEFISLVGVDYDRCFDPGGAWQLWGFFLESSPESEVISDLGPPLR
jgi:hypothetical protein